MDKSVALLLLATLSMTACTGSGSETCQPQGTELRLMADNHRFSTGCLAAPADQAFTIAFQNDDSSPHGVHNVVIQGEDGTAVFSGKGLRPGGTSIVYEVQPLTAGTYTFSCTTHPFMKGTFIVG